MRVLQIKEGAFGSRVVLLERTHVGAVPARFFRPLSQVLLQAGDAESWEVVSMTVWGSVALAGDPEAEALLACSPSTLPPRDSVAASTFHGIRLQACTLVGEYEYTPRDNDVVEFYSEVDWLVLDGVWRARRKGTLIVDPANYWDVVEQSDCYCPGSSLGAVGFSLEVDATTGALLDYQPGLNCVVC